MEALPDTDNAARASTINIDDITCVKNNARILHQLQSDDRFFDSLSVDFHEEMAGGGLDWQYFASATDLGWLGFFVGNSTTLKTLAINAGTLDRHNPPSINPSIRKEHVELFCRGLCRNRSIEKLRFERMGVFGEDIVQMTNQLFKNIHLTHLVVERCNLGAQGGRFLSLALKGCRQKSLELIKISGCEIGDGQMTDIIAALNTQHELKEIYFSRASMIGANACSALKYLVQRAKNLRNLSLVSCGIDGEGVEILAPALVGERRGSLMMSGLEKLVLTGNPISFKGCRALSSLLENPLSNLRKLYLAGCGIGDESCTALATSLTNNYKLTSLSVRSNYITQKGWSAFSRLMCDTPDINKTFSSNHTLQYLGHGISVPSDLSLLLQLMSHAHAQGWSKEKVAVNKIVRTHPCIDVQAFFEWEFKVLPLLVGWFENATVMVGARGYDQDAVGEKDMILVDMGRRELYAIYQFVRAMPLEYVEAHTGKKVNINESMNSSKRMKMTVRSN